MNVKRILLAEDDADDQKLFSDFLSHRTDILLLPVAENGVELLEALEKMVNNEFPHFIILDQNMPKSNGLQTLKALKASSQYAHLPVIIYSTYTDEKLITNSKAEGAVLVMAKPVSQIGYEEMLETILKTIASN